MGLKVLYPEPDQASQETLTVDIVAVHGLNGDPTDTWTDAKTKAFWLKDFLHHDLKGARIMTFGYNADIAFGNTTASIKDHAMDLLGCLIDEREGDAETQRPIIFIAHSLGGIIVKEALTWAHVEPQYSRIKESTLGIAFFGTPHRGSEKADYGKVLVKVVSGVMVRPKSKLVNALHCNSETLMDLTSKFKFQARPLQIAAFYELKPTVEKYSALLEIEGEDQVPANANHQDMCKFGSRDNETHQKLVKRLNRMLKVKENASNKTASAQNHIQSRAPHNKYFEVPRNVSSIFTGREDICQDLQERCLPSNPPSAQMTQKRYVLHGLGGSGKTQIGLKFAQDYRESFYGVFFIDASSASRAEQGFSAIAERCQVGNSMDEFKRWLTNLAEDWLLIIDNADDPSLDILPYFPPSCRGTIIITTRNPDCKIHATVGSRDIGAMDREEAISLLLKASGEQETDSCLRIRALPVVETLWSLALAIIQAGAVIRQKLYTFEDYSNAYDTRRKELLSFQPAQASSDYDFTVYTTWEVSKESIRAIANGQDATQEASKTAINALDLLTFFGFCHFDDIWEDFFQVAWGKFTKLSASQWWRPKSIQKLLGDRPPERDAFPFRQALSLLSSYSLIQWSDLRVSLHPLVHSWIRDSLVEEAQLRHWTSSLTNLALMGGGNGQSYEYHRRLMPHVQACLGVRDLKYLLIDDTVVIERAQITSYLLDVYSHCHQPGELLRLSEIALEYTRKSLGDGHDLTWRFVDHNISAHNYLHQYQETINKVETWAEDFLSSPSPVTSTVTVSIMSQLMEAYNNLKHTKKALDLGEKLVPLCIDNRGEDDVITCGVMHELARSYVEVGRWGEAVELGKRVIGRQETFLSDDDPTFLSSKNELAVIYIDMGLYHEAVDILRHVVEKRKIVLADDHPSTLLSQVMLATAYDGLGQPGTGIPLLVHAIGLGEKSGVPDAELQFWKRNLARFRAYEAYLLRTRQTEPFQPEVVISLLVEAIEMGEKIGVADEELREWRSNLAWVQALEAGRIWETRTEPFQPDVFISLLVSAVELGEKGGESDEVLQHWRKLIQEWQPHEVKSLSEQQLKRSTPEPKNRKRRRSQRG